MAFPVAIPIVILDAFWVIYAEKVGYGPYFTTISLFANVFFVLTALLLVNLGLRRFAPRLALSQAELLTVYSMVAIGAALAGHDMVPSLIQHLGHPYRFNTDANGWLGRFGMYLPEALMVSDPEVLKGYYTGNSSFYRPENYQPWLRPILLWTVFIMLLFAGMQCLNVLVRQGWQERERLPFPVVEIPMQMTSPDGHLWKSGLFWIGFGVCAALEILNGIAWLVPGVPSIDVKHHNLQGEGIFATRPWNAMGFTCYSLYPFAVGLGYLLPLDLLFSCWFFYLFWKAQMVLSASFALDVTPDFPFVREQSFGGYFAILSFMLWNGRSYFSQVWRRIWNEPADLDDSKEALSYRAAFLGFVICFGSLCIFMIWAGMSPAVAVAAFAIYFCLSVAVTRLRAELGPPVHDLHFTGPDHILTRSFGTPAYSGNDLTMLTFFYWFNRAYRSHPQPVAIEGLKAARQTHSSQKVMFWGLMLAALVGTISVFWAYLHLAYSLGTQAKWNQGSGFANEAFNRLNGWMQTPQPPNGLANGAIGIGFVFCSLLMIARIKIPWFPFHPIGYAISSSWSMNLVWMPLLIAWVLKGLILRYGGVRLYRQAMPFFLGIILGQMIVGTLWHLICIYLETVPYSFWGG
ncbi:MAG: hypothetical protein OHK0029_40970 [Armatimonadaceae bacterium]